MPGGGRRIGRGCWGKTEAIFANARTRGREDRGPVLHPGYVLSGHIGVEEKTGEGKTAPILLPRHIVIVQWEGGEKCQKPKKRVAKLRRTGIGLAPEIRRRIYRKDEKGSQTCASLTEKRTFSGKKRAPLRKTAPPELM